MGLLVTSDQRIDHGDTNTTSKISEQIEQPRGVADLLVRERAERDCGKRHEHHPGGHPAENDWRDERPLRNVERQPSHPQRRDAEERESSGHNPAIVDSIRKYSDHRHDEYRADSARADGQSRGPSRVAEERLIKQWKNRDDSVNHAPEQRHHQTSNREIAIGEHAQIHQRMPGDKLTDDESDESDGDRGDRELDTRRAEPVLLLTFIE